MSVDDLQKALDKFPELHDAQYWKLNVHDPDAVSDFLYYLNDWHKQFIELFSVFQKTHEKLLKELDEYKETCKILSDKPLMDSIKKARQRRSKSSPYEPLR